MSEDDSITVGMTKIAKKMLKCNLIINFTLIKNENEDYFVILQA